MAAEPSALAGFLVATLALNLTPGPDMLYVAARSLAQGRSAGLVSALGIGAGCLVHTVAAAVGLSALLASSATAFTAVRYAGAAYLVYLGVRLVVDGRPAKGTAVSPAGLPAIFWQGVVTNVLNPKVALFFLAFLPQFADPSRGGVGWQIAGLGLTFNMSGTLVNAAVALLAATAGLRFGARRGLVRVPQRLAGGVCIALGLRLALGGGRR